MKVWQITDVEDPIYDELVDALHQSFPQHNFERTLDDVVLQLPPGRNGSKTTLYILKVKLTAFAQGFMVRATKA